MKIIADYPPNLEQIVAAFPVVKRYHRNVVFTYGDACYVPSGNQLSPDLEIHELTHSQQQELVGGAEIWWNKYCTDPDFRFDQELNAYRNQYQYAVENMNRHDRRALLKKISHDLSSDLYGNLTTMDRAKELITETQ